MQRKIPLSFHRPHRAAPRPCERILIFDSKCSGSKTFTSEQLEWPLDFDLFSAGTSSRSRGRDRQHARRVRSPESCCDLCSAYCRCHGRVTFLIRSLQVSFTNVNASVFGFGRLNLYVAANLHFFGLWTREY